MTSHWTADGQKTLCGLSLTKERYARLQTTKDIKRLNCGRCERSLALGEPA